MPLSNVGYIIHQVRKGLQDMAQIITLLQVVPEIQDQEKSYVCDALSPILTIQNISFGYTPDRMILNNVSLSMGEGNTIAIVGSSGSGKSTIAKLLLRMYDVSSGSIFIDGTDIRTIKQQDLRSFIGIVPQDITLFNDTLYNNIAYGNPEASRDDVCRAAEQAQLSQFIVLLPQGYETIVGERGLKLSGGEKQRIAIARVLLKKPRIYLFDEATSSLDSNTEREIQHTIASISAGMTTIIIAHRLSTITHADNIIVLDQGTIAEQGTHNNLLQRNALYAKLWNKQQYYESTIISPSKYHDPDLPEDSLES
jgi:ATP-binding cassette subfamily B protein